MTEQPVMSTEKICIYCQDCGKIVAQCNAFWATEFADFREPLYVVDGKLLWSISTKERTIQVAKQAAIEQFYKHIREEHM